MHERIERITEAVERLEHCIVATLLTPRAKTQFESGAIAHDELAPYIPALSKLSSEYTSERRYALPPMAAKDELTAYALYFLPINFSKFLYLLHELPEKFSGGPIRILDFGAGPGTATLAALEYFGAEVQVTLADHSPSMLKVAKMMLSAFHPTADRLTYCSDVEVLQSEAQYDLIIVGNILTELPHEQRLKLTEKLFKKVAPHGIFFILEPALHSATRGAMSLRDALLDKHPDLNPIFPCTRRDPCPMLRQGPDNWCHGILKWENSRLVSELDELSGFNKHRLKYTAFIFQRGAMLREGLRILQEPERKKYGYETLLCGDGIYGRKIIKRDCGEEVKRMVSRAEQFDLIALDLKLLKAI